MPRWVAEDITTKFLVAVDLQLDADGKPVPPERPNTRVVEMNAGHEAYLAAEAAKGLAYNKAVEAQAKLLRDATTASVGVKVSSLTLPQVIDLLAMLLHQHGAIDVDGKIKPLKDWAD